MPNISKEDCSKKAKERVEWCKENGYAGKHYRYVALPNGSSYCTSGASFALVTPGHLLVQLA